VPSPGGEELDEGISSGHQFFIVAQTEFCSAQRARWEKGRSYRDAENFVHF